MAKTVKEMAYKSLLKENVKSTESDYSRGYLIGYFNGANAVLLEIECILDSPIDYVVENVWDGNLNDVVGMIRQKINELKGK